MNFANGRRPLSIVDSRSASRSRTAHSLPRNPLHHSVAIAQNQRIDDRLYRRSREGRGDRPSVRGQRLPGDRGADRGTTEARLPSKNFVADQPCGVISSRSRPGWTTTPMLCYVLFRAHVRYVSRNKRRMIIAAVRQPPA